MNQEIVRRISEPQVLFNNNKTNPSSIYIKGQLKFEGYKTINLHCFVDTGSSLCLASKHVIPPEHWEQAPRPIHATIADGSTIAINTVCKNLDIKLGNENFHIPTIYMQETGIDFLLGNNFCLTYGPFIQEIDKIIFHKKTDTTTIKVELLKVRKAFQVGRPGYLEFMKKDSKNSQPPPVNITPEKINIFKDGGVRATKEKDFIFNLKKLDMIKNLLHEVSSENPLDPDKTKQWMQASIKLFDPNDYKKGMKEKAMRYSPMDRQEFSVQIAELLRMKVIRPSNSPFQSPAFLVNNEAEKRRGKKRMVINYMRLNTLTIGDAHNLPNKDEALTVIRGKKWFSSFDCKSGFWQVLLDEDSKPLTSFTCPGGQYEWNVVPFGLKQAPSIFQRHAKRI